VEVLADQLRPRLVAATWQNKPAFSKLLKQITQVPTRPTIYPQITAAWQNQEAGIEDVAERVACEPRGRRGRDRNMRGILNAAFSQPSRDTARAGVLLSRS